VTCGNVVDLGVAGLGCSGTTEGFTDADVPCNTSANYVVCTVPLGVTLPLLTTIACSATNSTRMQMCH
jgi:hypothetical protein